MRLGPVLPDDLPDLEVAQPANHHRPHRQADRQRRHGRARRAEGDVLEYVEYVEDRDPRVQMHINELVEEVVEHQANSTFNRSTTRSVRMPREPFTSTRSP